MSKEDVVDSILLILFASPVVALILGAVFKKQRDKVIQYTFLVVAVLLVLAYLAS